MELEVKTRILAGLAHTQVEAHETSVRFGYWEKERQLSEVIAKIHRDVSKALEIGLIGDGPSPNLKDCTRLEETLADAVIRMFDLAGGMNLSLASAVLSKLDYNEALSQVVRKDF